MAGAPGSIEFIVVGTGERMALLPPLLSRRLRTAALVLGVYLIVAWAPASGELWKAIGFYPEKTPLGRLHQRAVKELLD